MASIRKHGDRWRAFVERQGIRKTKVFPTKREATDWAARQEYEILQGAKVAARITLGEALHRYAREISPSKRGHSREVVRLEFMAREIGHHQLGDLGQPTLAAWRDARLRQASPGTVRRDLALLGAVLRAAREEWGLMAQNPLDGVRKPPAGPPRTRLPTPEEMERLAHAAGSDLSTDQARAFHAFKFACETAMRAGEIVGLTWGQIDGRVAHLPKTKNGFPRDVPLSSAALRLLDDLKDRGLSKSPQVFQLTSRQLDGSWRKLRDRAGVEGLRFHDSRHFATVQLAKKVPVLDLARILGHRDLRMLMVYYNESAADIADRLG